MAKLIIIKNKDFDNTFATACIIRYFKFEPLQAEQCALIIDKKGRYALKEGMISELVELSFLLDDLGFNTQVID
jgi:hypothetical protein